MSKFSQKLRQNNLVFIFLFLFIGSFPILLKLLLTGSIGSTFNFYFFVLWIPAVAITFSLFRSQTGALFTTVMLLGAFIISYVHYPLDAPPMDFRRQIVQQLDIWIVIAVLASLGFQIVFLGRTKARNQ